MASFLSLNEVASGLVTIAWLRLTNVQHEYDIISSEIKQDLTRVSATNAIEAKQKLFSTIDKCESWIPAYNDSNTFFKP